MFLGSLSACSEICDTTPCSRYRVTETFDATPSALLLLIINWISGFFEAGTRDFVSVVPSKMVHFDSCARHQ
jgi:hypothetical protein